LSLTALAFGTNTDIFFLGITGTSASSTRLIALLLTIVELCTRPPSTFGGVALHNVLQRVRGVAALHAALVRGNWTRIRTTPSNAFCDGFLKLACARVEFVDLAHHPASIAFLLTFLHI
jgi:hypothetical protein